MMRAASAVLMCILLGGCFVGVRDKVRYFVMHAEDSTPAHPKCYFVTQHLRDLRFVEDDKGSVDLTPTLDFEYADAPCTSSSLPYSAQGTFKGSPLGYSY